jgi:hypothetical protein
LVRTFRLLVFGIAWHSDAFTCEKVSCVSPTRWSSHIVRTPHTAA